MFSLFSLVSFWLLHIYIYIYIHIYIWHTSRAITSLMNQIKKRSRERERELPKLHPSLTLFLIWVNLQTLRCNLTSGFSRSGARGLSLGSTAARMEEGALAPLSASLSSLELKKVMVDLLRPWFYCEGVSWWIFFVFFFLLNLLWFSLGGFLLWNCLMWSWILLWGLWNFWESCYKDLMKLLI